MRGGDEHLSAVLAQPRVKRLLSTDHFSVDGTLIEAWASMKSFTPKSLSSGEDLRNKAYDAEDFVNELRSMKVTPHAAQNTSGRSSAIDSPTTRHAGYALSQRIRKRIEEAFGRIKTVGGQAKTRFRGRDRVAWAFTFAAAAYNLARLPKLLATPT